MTPRSPATWVLSLYFMQGLPFFMVNVVAGLMLKSLGVANDEIARWTGLLGLAWVFKPLWSPLLEAAPSQKWLVVAAQGAGALTLGAVALALQLPAYFAAVIALLALAAIASASHDIACDGLYIASLDARQRALWAGWLGACFNAAKLAAMGGLVILAGALEPRIGVAAAWATVFGLTALAMALLAGYHAWALPDTRRATAPSADATATATATAPGAPLAGTLVDVLRSFFQLPGVGWAIAFIVLFRAGEAQVQTIGPLFLKDAVAAGGLGLATSEVGWSYGTAGTLAFLAGSIASGYFTAWLGLRRALLTLVVAMNLPNLAFWLLAVAQPKSLWLISAAVSLETFGYGFGFVAVILFMMQFVAGSRYQTAHYALATGFMALGYVLFKTVSGDVQQALGYRHFFLWVLVCALPVFAMLRRLPIRDEPPAAAPTPAPAPAPAPAP
ncbi:MFS transporter [Aquabacterium sp. OR-4]|uniref:MFS transporter n=1 Tax=Aquabacterium sp. OR-4 TaxID=2978127 RepID=UPI0021B3462A|nr:MFS transporter [Aquabacterium sp. OR-4]MDT7836606.1 MFS transporter [Aquabacterium sp. OR-4]